MSTTSMKRLACATALAVTFLSRRAPAQVTPAAGYVPPDDKPAVKVGVTIFTNYTYQTDPQGKDANGNNVDPNSFDVTRGYINVTGQLNHLVAFRLTPDITRETGTGSSLNGSLTFRLKYAFGQLNMDDWLPAGSWVRLGLQQTPYVDYAEGIYRYRFQGPIFEDREGFITSSDFGFSGHVALPSDYGDVHVGFYNGDGYAKSEANDQKAVQLRASIRPAPGVAIAKGLRVTGFYDADHYASDQKRQRFIGNVTFEHPYVNAGFDYLNAKDRAALSGPEVTGEGYSIWATPRTPVGIEALLRYDSLKPNKDVDARKKRFIGGIAYWFSPAKGLATALLADYEKVDYDTKLNKPDERRWALHMLVNF
jgi:hypothetical protein